MRLKKIFVIAVLFLSLIGYNRAAAQTQEKEELDEDQFGKVVIQAVDADTLEPVKEVFLVYFFDCIRTMNNKNDAASSRVVEWYWKTNNKGRLVTMIRPSSYYLQFIPESTVSKYEFGPSPLYTEKSRYRIAVESHKTTEVIKKIELGGKLKIILVDPSGNRINPRQVFPGELKFGFDIESEEGYLYIFPGFNLHEWELTGRENNLNDGEVLIHRLYPDKYNLSVSFDFTGVKHKDIEGIQVNRDRTTTVEVIMDINDNTGIEGYITDQNGKSLKNLYVDIDNTVTKTDQNGFYRIVGINTGTFIIGITNSYDPSGFFINKSFQVEIIKSQIIRKDFVIEIHEINPGKNP